MEDTRPTPWCVRVRIRAKICGRRARRALNNGLGLAAAQLPVWAQHRSGCLHPHHPLPGPHGPGKLALLPGTLRKRGSPLKNNADRRQIVAGLA